MHRTSRHRTRGAASRGRRLATRIAVLSFALLVGSCSSTPDGPPRAQDNACMIFAERPGWRDAVMDSSKRWGAPPHVQMAIIWRESSFRAEARTPRTYALGIIPTGRVSSAYGYAQAIDSTWDWYRDETGNSGADRDDFDDATDFVGWYMAKTRRTNGLAMTDAYSQYLAYHEGHTGYKRGSWRSKAWLKKAANAVAAQARRYEQQMSLC
ncbi:MAG: transglycosylase SLT domain-containing protein [Pseudomonadota bacterium]